MKKSLIAICLSLLVFSTLVYSNTLSIPYSGGKQSGIFKIKGDIASRFTNPLDTIIIDSNIFITNFLASKSFTQCFSVPRYQYGLLIRAGLQGKIGNADTNWNNSKTFPDSLLSLDSIPKSDYVSPKDLGANPKGINVDTLYYGGECAGRRPHMISGYKSIVYFKYNKGSADRYGKLMIYGYELDTLPYFDGPSIENLKMVYTVSSSKDLDDGSIPTPIIPIKSEKSKGTSSSLLIDPNGRTIQKTPFLNRKNIPLLSPNP